MPTRKVIKNGKVCYKWGNSGKTYCGKNAKTKANKQAKAIYASGYKEK